MTSAKTNAECKATAAQALQEMMNVWNTIMSSARAEFPEATGEQLFQIVSSVMRHSLGMK